jgi:hypothetical protein
MAGSKESWCCAPNRMLAEIDFRTENTFLSGMLNGEICHCGDPAAHVLEQMIPIDDPKPNRRPLRTFLCDNHFRKIMGPAAWLSQKANKMMCSAEGSFDGCQVV